MPVITDLRAPPRRYHRPDSTSNSPPKHLDDVRQILRPDHDARHTERSSGEGIVRFVPLHGMRSHQDLCPAEPKIEAFLTDLAMHGKIAAAGQ
ncbi:MAG TPA: hypothetical protein VGC99_17015, partial [Candidatus Tectomicrobia bacterium]